MAKIVLTLEDTVDDNGTPGMTVHWDSDPKEDDGGAAFNYCAAFLEFIMAHAKTAAIVDDEDQNPSEEDPSLN